MKPQADPEVTPYSSESNVMFIANNPARAVSRKYAAAVIST